VVDSELGFVHADRAIGLLECDPALMQAAIKQLAREVARMREMIVTVHEDKKLTGIERL
jgi:hypothetical protein